MWAKTKRFLKKSWWWILLIIGGLFALLWAIFDRRDPGDYSEPKGPTFTERAKTEIERVQLEGELEKAKVKAEADAQRAELEVIEQVGRDNPQEGRRQLAAWLSANL